MDNSGSDVPDSPALADYMLVISRRIHLIVAVAIVVAAGAFLFVGDADPVVTGYRSTTEVVPPRSSLVDNDPSAEVHFVTSDRIITLAEDAVEDDIDLDQLTVSAVDETDIVAITYSSDDQAEAELVSQSLADAFLTGRTAELDARRQGVIDRTAVEVNAITDELRTAASQVAESDDNSVDQASAAALVTVLQNQLTRLRTESSLATIATVESGSVFRATETTEVRSRTIPPAALAAALIALGLLAGVAVAFTVDRLDWRVRSVDDAAAIKGAMVLAHVPYTSIVFDPDDLPDPFFRAATAVWSAARRSGPGAALLSPVLPVGDHSCAIDNIAAAHRRFDPTATLIDVTELADGDLDSIDVRFEITSPDSPADRQRANGNSVEGPGAKTPHAEDDNGVTLVRSLPPLDHPVTYEAAAVTDVLILVARIGRTRRSDLASALALATNAGISECWVIVEERRRRFWRHRFERPMSTTAVDAEEDDADPDRALSDVGS